jgi:hypothetical protein
VALIGFVVLLLGVFDGLIEAPIFSNQPSRGLKMRSRDSDSVA